MTRTTARLLCPLVALVASLASACSPPLPAACPMGSTLAPGARVPPAIDAELGSAVGERVATGSTTGAGNEVVASCGGPNAPERVYAWSPPEDGVYILDTVGSDYDTLLAVVDRCTGRAIACNDDFLNGRRESRVVVSLRAGQPVAIDIEGFGESAGTYVLNIARSGGGGGDGVGVDAAREAGADAASADAGRGDGATADGSGSDAGGADATSGDAVSEDAEVGDAASIDGAGGDVASGG